MAEAEAVYRYESETSRTHSRQITVLYGSFKLSDACQSAAHPACGVVKQQKVRSGVWNTPAPPVAEVSSMLRLGGTDLRSSGCTWNGLGNPV